MSADLLTWLLGDAPTGCDKGTLRMRSQSLTNLVANCYGPLHGKSKAERVSEATMLISALVSSGSLRRERGFVVTPAAAAAPVAAHWEPVLQTAVHIVLMDNIHRAPHIKLAFSVSLVHSMMIDSVWKPVVDMLGHEAITKVITCVLTELVNQDMINYY